ncbi:MAG: thiamine phosphate synthase [Butyricicoccus pullicaecorum]|nr:thiamine phosphate synthase [Butyricicoccus pullicaecorum]
MSMFDHVLAVTNRHLCETDFLEQIERIAMAQPVGIVLREKDLSEAAYHSLAQSVLAICKQWNTPCILHHFSSAALALDCPNLHLPLPDLLTQPDIAKQFSQLGVSVHSAEEAQTAYAHGASYLTAGHIFPTDCKPDLPPRGLSFLHEVCAAVPIPVYALGGVRPQNVSDCLASGSAGVAVMSGVMCNLSDWTFHI